MRTAARPSPAAASSSSSTSTTTHEYTVLYYKRKNKIHKSRGVSKLDGTLTLVEGSATTPVSVTLVNSDTAAVVFRGGFRGNTCDFGIDETIAVGPYEVEILSTLQKSSKPQHRSTTGMTTIARRRPPGLGNRTTTRGLGSRTTKGLLGVKRPLASTLLRKPPVQPVVAAAKEESAPVVDNDENLQHTALPLVRKPFQRRPALGSKRTIGIGRTALAPRAVPATTSNNNNPSSLFKGAIGNLEVPHSIRKVLRPHQIEGVVFLWNCLTGNGRVAECSPHLDNAVEDGTAIVAPKGCILSDEMGLGKTLMTIATISALHRMKRTSRFVVVCPSSLVNNWAREFDKWLGKVGLPKRVVVRKGGDEGFQKLKAFTALKPTNTSEVLIVSYDLFRTKATILENVQKVALLVVDEGHRLKNTAGSQTMTALESLPCDARLCITATPLQNNLCDMYTIVNFVCPGVLGDLPTFRKRYEKPIQVAARKDCTLEQTQTAHESSRILDKILQSIMLRRLQKDVLEKLLPPKHAVLLFCRPMKDQRRVYQSIADQYTSKLGGCGPSPEALTALMELRKVCTHPSLIEQQQYQKGMDCRTSGKLLVVRELLQQIRNTAPSDKIVIVSNFTSTLTVIEDTILKPLELNFLRLDGSLTSADRQPLVDTFNRTSADRNFALTLSSKAGGVGLNVVGANRLVMVDPDWNPATDIQAMARIYREGQKKPCFIYRCFTSGTLEEVILQRQIQKGSLANMTVDRAYKSKGKGTGLNAEELRDCFTLKDERCNCDTRDKIGNWPDYEGATSLVSQDCTDTALLAVAAKGGTKDSLLSFVHLVRDDDKSQPPDSSQDDGNSASTEHCGRDDSDEEFEMEDVENESHGIHHPKPQSGSESSDEEFEFE